MAKSQARWNFRLGPIQFTSPMGVFGTAIIAGFCLACCCAGVVGLFD